MRCASEPVLRCASEPDRDDILDCNLRHEPVSTAEEEVTDGDDAKAGEVTDGDDAEAGEELSPPVAAEAGEVE